MATAYPGALDTTGSQLRTDIASTDDLDASGKEHDTMHVNAHGAVVALETKLGIGASAASGASDGDALTKQADGSTAWEAVPSGVSWSGSTANGLATYGSSSSVVSESTATYDGTSLVLTTSGGGLKMDGLASSDANTLDDYEEGTWTAAFTSGGGTVAPNTSYDTMNYTKIGRLVTVGGNVDGFTVSSPTGSLTMTGLPFAVADTAERSDRTAFVVTARGLVSAEDNIMGQLNAGGGLVINYGNGGTGGGGAHMATLIDAGSYIHLSATYVAAT
jgi:hypothetical protein